MAWCSDFLESLVVLHGCLSQDTMSRLSAGGHIQPASQRFQCWYYAHHKKAYFPTCLSSKWSYSPFMILQECLQNLLFIEGDAIRNCAIYVRKRDIQSHLGFLSAVWHGPHWLISISCDKGPTCCLLLLILHNSLMFVTPERCQPPPNKKNKQKFTIKTMKL